MELSAIYHASEIIIAGIHKATCDESYSNACKRLIEQIHAHAPPEKDIIA